MIFSKKNKIQISAVLVFALIISVVSGISNDSNKEEKTNLVAGLTADLNNSTLNTATISAGVASELLMVSVKSTSTICLK